MSDFDIENFPISEAAKRMMSTISEEFYRDSCVMKWLQQVMGMEWDDAVRIIDEELPKQFFPETATWGLCYHEIKWQLPVRENLSYEERRKLIYQKRDFKAPMTPYKMEEYLRRITGAEVHVMDCHDPGQFGFVPDHPNKFKVVFIKEGTINSKAAIQELNRIKQSHTVYYTIEDRVLPIIFLWKNEVEIPRLNLGMDFSMNHAEQYFDGLSLLDGSQKFDGGYTCFRTSSGNLMECGMKEHIECSVTIKKNLYHFDGSLSWDGSTKMNACVKKEEL